MGFVKERQVHSFCHSEEKMNGEVDHERKCKWDKSKVERREKQKESESCSQVLIKIH